jgi:hypothetical protein
MKRPLVLLTALCLPFLAVLANAQTRAVFVNGQRMTEQQIAQLESLACTAIPDGNYWVNLNSGAWGYVGNWQVQGFFGDHATHRRVASAKASASAACSIRRAKFCAARPEPRADQGLGHRDATATDLLAWALELGAR